MVRRVALELVPLANAVVSLAPPVMIPNAPQGTRVIVEVTGFDVKGERFCGHQKGVAGADWMTATPDGTLGTLDVRVTLETDDGAAVYMHYSGRLDLSEGFGAKPIYNAPLFETGDARYAWLNDIQGVAVGELTAEGVVYQVYGLK